MKKLLYTLLLTGTALTTQAQEVKWNTPGAGNPFLPGYFADPTVKKFGDTYFIYATTDGSGAGFGPSQFTVCSIASLATCMKALQRHRVAPGKTSWEKAKPYWCPTAL